jgi:type I restriction-modification system DNA methylase subunit
MTTKKETFASLISGFKFHYDSRTVFDDFLTLTLCAFSQNPATGKSYDEDLYMQTMEKYKNSDLRFNFPKMLACLTLEMTDRIENKDGTGYDILGEYYEQNIAQKGLSQFFTPWPICTFMAHSAYDAVDGKEEKIRILEPACGSGRMLMAGRDIFGRDQHYFGIDTDLVCVKMTVLNMFLSGIFSAEIMCANALLPEDFRVSYRTSFLPFGIFRIEQKEKSPLWHILKNSWNVSKKPSSENIPLFSEARNKESQPGEVSQLHLF